MPHVIIEKPVLNSPYEEPSRYFYFDEEGITDKVVESRRLSSYFIPIARPKNLLKPLKDSWPTYNGDYSGKRYSALAQVNQSNVKHLSLAWVARMTPGPGNAAPGG